MQWKNIVNTMTQSYSKDSIDIFTKICMIRNVQHEPQIVKSMSNVIELHLLDHCVHPMCYVMDVMTNLRQYYSSSHKVTKREDISNPFEVLERQTLEVEHIVEKNKYLTILFFGQLYTHLHTCQKSHPFMKIRYLGRRLNT